MTSLFKPPSVPMPKMPEPKTIRMPREDSKETIAAGLKTREAFMRRRGRQSTIMTERGGNGSVVGSSGKVLGV